ncbi:MAG: carboxypeptidase-like regulatory domain-containing protein [Bacteroidales bacterium]|jgi:hypothetical protein|nr:carboxypeptidase-like regulatory domain-containing protein [Bacteroidales bacterium]
MSHANGFGTPARIAIALLFFMATAEKLAAQQGILDSAFTFREGIIRTGSALEAISAKTGYSFTYDSRLINTEGKSDLTFTNEKLAAILMKIAGSDSLAFSVIDKYIIISRKYYARPGPETPSRETIPGYLSGRVTDIETGEPLPFATLGLKGSGRGTVTNSNGVFGMKITGDIFNDTLIITYLGYKRRAVPVRNSGGNDYNIAMEKEFISIPEIIIRNQVPLEIISKSRKAVPRNFGTTPSLMTAFYREGVMKKNELQTYSEAVIRIFKSPYSNTLQNDQVKILKSRKIDNADITDTLAVRLKAGLGTCLELDGARNTFDFLLAESLHDYTYRLTDIVTYDEESAYAIEFEQKEGIEEPLYKGTIYINTSDFAILHADFELNPKYVQRMKESFVANSTHGFVTWPLTVKYSVTYRKLGDRYFLSHVRGDLLFTSSRKRKLFKSQFKVFFELAVTDIRTESVLRFEREELAPIHSVFSKTIKSYDPLFWGDQDFLRPEDNLLQALRNMKVRMQEFNEDR